MRATSNLAAQKRERISETDAPKGQKRRRTAQPNTDAPSKHLLQILTGADTGPPPSGAKSKPARRDDESSHDDSSEEESAGDESVQADEEPAPQVNAPSDKPPSYAWMHTLSEAHSKKINVTVLLERANLETIKQGGRSGGMVLLNCEEHRHQLRKTGRDANDARPDITHQCLLALLDSPLNKAGKLKVYIRTAKNVLIEVHPQTRIPRTIRRFSGLMAELLEKFKVRGTSGSAPLLKVIRNPITSHLPVGTRKIVCTYNTENVVDMREHAGEMAALALKDVAHKGAKASEEEIEQDAETVNVLYVIGAMAHGKVVEDWADDYICVSEYPLSAATVCSRLVYSYECLFGIL